jgi:D-serine deaminase-like pyridoxal phosphate-dependent protein
MSSRGHRFLWTISIATHSARIGVALGERIELTPPHCDPTVDRYSVYHFVRGDTLVDIAEIEAARRSQ